MIYLDNAATSGFKPKPVITAVTAALKNLSCNPGRSGHKLSLNCLKLIIKTRENIADFFGCDNSDNVVFTKNCTEALNLAILGSYKNGAHIITSVNEHNSVLRPLFELYRKNEITLSVCQPDNNGRITFENILKLVNNRTSLMCLNLISNVSGGMCEFEKIAALCREKNIKLLCDAAQAAGYIDIDMKKAGIHILAFPGHKGLYGPTGTGGLCFLNGISLRPLNFGGTGTESENTYQPETYPESLESGTLNVIGIAGLNAGINYVKQNKAALRQNLSFLKNLFLDGISKIAKIKVYSYDNPVGIVSLLAGSLFSSETADILSGKYNIAVRGGLHCAPLIHRHLGTLESGLTRFSLSSFNTYSDIQKALQALTEIAGSKLY